MTPAAVTAAAAPAGASATYIGSTAALNVAFSATGGAATNLQITSALSTGWTLAGGTLPCAQVGGGNTCRATLNYAPVAATSASTLVLQYAYTDNFGESRTGQLSIPYSAVPHIAYITNTGSNTVTQCTAGVTGALGNCTQVSSPVFSTPSGITIDGARAYVAEAGAASVSVCNVDSSGLSGCIDAVTGPDELVSVALDGDIAFISNQPADTVETCNVAADGTFSGCTVVAAATPLLSAVNLMTLQGSTLYIGNATAPDITLCSVTAGVITTCENNRLSAIAGKVVFGGTSAYVTLSGQNSVQQCAVGSGGTLTACSDSGAGTSFDAPIGITLFGGYAYVVNRNNNTISQCAVAANGQLSGCFSTGSGLNSPFDIAIQ